MKANKVVSYDPVYNGRNYGGTKPLIEERNLVVKARKGDHIHDSSGIRTLVTVRVYGTKARNYVSIWVHAPDDERGMSCAGHGLAGGYGYHRPSAAMQEALESAGIKLANRIDGVGDSAMDDALRAIAAHFGYSKAHIV